MRQLRVSLAYLAREKLHELRHPDRGLLVGLAALLFIGLWFELSLIFALRHFLEEITSLATLRSLDARLVLVSAYFFFLSAFAQLLILYGFARAQTVSLERFRFLPLRSAELYFLELATKILVAWGAVLTLAPLAAATAPLIRGSGGRPALLVATSLILAVALAELATLLLLLIEGTTEAGRVVFRVLFAVLVLGGYSLRFLLPREQALALLMARWAPWSVAARAALDPDPAAMLALLLSVGALFFLGLLVYRAVYLGDARVAPSSSWVDGAAFFRLLGSPLALAGRQAHAIFRVDTTQIFRNPLAFTIFASPAVVLLVLHSGTGLLAHPAWRFRVPLLIVFLLSSLLGLNPIGRDGRAYPLLRLLPLRRQSELIAKLGVTVSVSATCGSALCGYYFWGEWLGLAARVVALSLYGVGLAVVAAYLGIRRPFYGRLTGGPLVRFPFMGIGLGLAALAEGVARLLPAFTVPVTLSVLSALVGCVFYPLALKRLAAWRMEDVR